MRTKPPKPVAPRPVERPGSGTQPELLEDDGRGAPLPKRHDQVVFSGIHGRLHLSTSCRNAAASHPRERRRSLSSLSDMSSGKGLSRASETNPKDVSESEMRTRRPDMPSCLRRQAGRDSTPSWPKRQTTNGLRHMAENGRLWNVSLRWAARHPGSSPGGCGILRCPYTGKAAYRQVPGHSASRCPWPFPAS